MAEPRGEGGSGSPPRDLEQQIGASREERCDGHDEKRSIADSMREKVRASPVIRKKTECGMERTAVLLPGAVFLGLPKKPAFTVVNGRDHRGVSLRSS